MMESLRISETISREQFQLLQLEAISRGLYIEL